MTFKDVFWMIWVSWLTSLDAWLASKCAAGSEHNYSCCKLVDFTHLRDVNNLTYLFTKDTVYIYIFNWIISIHHPVPGSDIPVAPGYSPPFFSAARRTIILGVLLLKSTSGRGRNEVRPQKPGQHENLFFFIFFSAWDCPILVLDDIYIYVYTWNT